MTPEQLNEFKSQKENDIAKYHFNIGLWIRNNWELWGGSRLAKYFNDLGIYYPDDMSGIILTSFYRYLNNKDVKLKEQVKYYQDFWKKAKPPDRF